MIYNMDNTNRYAVRNDTPVFLKPRRTVYFLVFNGEIITKSNGHRLHFSTFEAAQRAADKRNKKISA